MKLFPVFVISLFFLILNCLPAFAETNDGFIRYTMPRDNLPEIKVLPPEEDNLYSGAEIISLDKQLSTEEKQQENSSDLEYIDEDNKRPELTCAQIQPQVAQFIFNNLKQNDSHSVIEKRKKILFINNLKNFQEIAEQDIDKSNFEVHAALMHLKINEHQDIYRICVSKNPNDKKFKEVFAIIYPYINYYKVVVTNLITVPEELDKVTFIYDWQ